MTSPASHHYLSVGKSRIHIAEWSSEQDTDKDATNSLDPLVLLHGFTGSAEAVGGLAEGLSKTHRVLAIDLPGHGQTEISKTDQSILQHFSMEATVSYLWSALDELGLFRVNLVGYSMGGRVALSAAVAHRQRVKSVVCIGASAGITDPTERAKRREADEILAESILKEGVEQFIDLWLTQPLFATLASRLSPADFQTSRKQRLANTPEGLAFSLRGIGTGAMKPLRDELSDIDFPCLWIAGEEDEKFAAIAKEMSKTMPNGSHILIPYSGHSTHLENPATTLDAIDSFLTQHNQLAGHSKATESRVLPS